MKNFASILILIPLLFLSCQQKDHPINQQVDFSDMQLDLELFKDGLGFGSLTEKNSLNSRLNLLYKEVDLMRKENPEIETVTFLLNKRGDKIYLDGYSTVSKQGEVIDNYYRSNAISAGSPVPAGNTSGCPLGYTNLGSCSNTSSCVGDLLYAHMIENLVDIGDCVETRVSVGMTSTIVCGKACS